MMKLLAPVDNIRFDIEDALEKQTYSLLPLPFTGMDKSAAAVCELYARLQCENGVLCPFRHVRGDKSVVCKHWLRGLCKKGDDCEFLHEYDMSKMPECYFYSKYSQCGNKECEFLHINSESKIKDCPWYDRGFCRHGPNCKNRHVKKVICQNYLFGFCIDGPSCKFKHPKFELPVADISTMQKKQLFVCDYCGEKGHKIASCFKLNPEHRQAYQAKREMAIHAADLNTSFNKSENDINGEEHNLENKSDDANQNKEQLQQQQPGGPISRSSSFASNPSMTGYQPRPNFHHHHHHHHGHHHGHHFQHFNNQNHANPGGHYTPLPPSEVTCFKCGEKGHYANKCNKSVLSFLRGGSNPNQNNPSFENQS